MADTKITALTALTAADPANDVIPIVDVSDTSMAASGTTKKISVNNILGASGTATLASATITGDLTVDTSTLKVDSTNNRVGIGTVSPNNTLTVRGSQDAGIEINSADSNSSRLIFAYDPANTRWYINSTLSGSGTTVPLAFLIQNSEVARFNSTGNLAFANTKGIDFSATSGTGTSELLNDYEEGTFTPTVGGSILNGTAVYTTQIGLYTKIGRIVQIQIFVEWNTGTATGNQTVTGLPFTSNSTTGNYSVLNTYPINISLTALHIATSSIPPGTSIVNIYQIPTGGGADASVPCDAAGGFLLTGTYTV